MKANRIIEGPQIELVASRGQLEGALRRLDSQFTATWLDARDAFGLTWHLGEGKWIVGLNFDNLPDGRTAMSTLAHEATHVKQGWMRMIGEDRPSDEFEAYAMDSIMSNLLGQYAKLVEKQNRRRLRKAPNRAVVGRTGRG